MRKPLLAATGLALAWVIGSAAAPSLTHGDEQATPEALDAGKPAADEPLGEAGITRESRRSIDRGMKWLLSTINSHGQVGADRGLPADLSCTAVTGLALLAEGNTPNGGPHAKELRLVLDAVLTMVERLPRGHRAVFEATLVQRKIGANADRFFAALFLSEVLGEAGDDDEDIRRALDTLVVDICAAQGKDGSWGDESWAPVLGTVMGWECLRSSASSGLKVDASAKLASDGLLAKLRIAMDSQESWMHDFYKNAASIRVLYSMGFREDPVFHECRKKVLKFAEWSDRPFTEAGGEEFLGFFLVTECLLQDDTGAGREWYPTIARKLVRVQNTDGSWTGHHCITHRTFCTAAALLSLQAPNYFLSMSNM